MIVRPFRLRSEEGGGIRGEARVPDGAPPRSAVILVHGFAAFRGWSFIPRVAATLVAGGFSVVTFDFSHNGIGDDPSRFTDLERFARNTVSRELQELLGVVDAALEARLIPRRPDRLGLWGHGRGGALALLAAREEPRVRALATWGVPATLERWSRKTREGWAEDGRIHVLDGRTGRHLPVDRTFLDDLEANRERLDPTRAAGEVSRPWLLLHGERDRSVPPDEARTLADRGPAARLHFLEGADHDMGVGHPLVGTSPALERALRLTREHFALHLGAD